MIRRTIKIAVLALALTACAPQQPRQGPASLAIVPTSYYRLDEPRPSPRHDRPRAAAVAAPAERQNDDPQALIGARLDAIDAEIKAIKDKLPAR